MEKLIKILEDLEPEVDYKTEEHLIDNHLIDSLAIISLVAEIEEEFDVSIPTVEIVPENFNSAKALWSLIERLIEDN